jgi:hypothetical protein
VWIAPDLSSISGDCPTRGATRRSRSSDWAESSTGTWTTVWTVGCHPRSRTGQFFHRDGDVGDMLHGWMLPLSTGSAILNSHMGCALIHGIRDTYQHLKLLIARPGMIGKIGDLYSVVLSTQYDRLYSVVLSTQYDRLYSVVLSTQYDRLYSVVLSTQYDRLYSVSSITRCIQYHPLYPVSPVSSITRIQYHRRYSVSRAVLIHLKFQIAG